MSTNVCIRPWLLPAIALLAGCGLGSGATLPPSRMDLNRIYVIYQRHIKNKEKPPSGLEDLATFEPIYPFVLKAIEDGQYVVVWNVTTKDGGTVLACQKDVPEQGGEVLMADGTVRFVSAAQFTTFKPSP